MTFGVLLLGQSAPLGPESFTQVSQYSYALELSGPLGQSIEHAREVALFITSSSAIPAHSALCLYVSAGSSDWEFRGFVDPSCKPSDSFALAFPRDPVHNCIVPPCCLGVQIEALVDAQQKEGKTHVSRQDWAHRVGLDLFRFMESYQRSNADSSDCMVVPADCFDRWWRRFEHKYSKDPNFLLRDSNSLH